MEKYFKLILIFCILFWQNSAKCQIVMDTTDLPDIGNIQISVKVDSLQGIQLNPGDEGDSCIWDFSDLLFCCGTVQASSDTLQWINPAATPNGQYFSFSGLSDVMNCVTYHSHVTHQDEKECEYFYYIKNTAGLQLTGMDKQNNIILNKYYNFFPLLTYGSTIPNIARISDNRNDTLYVTYISGQSTADAWGKITTPAGTVDAIRIFTAESVYDSIYVNGIGYQTGFTGNNYYYKWYAKGLKYPVLEIYKGIKHQKRTNFQKVLYAKSLVAFSNGINSQNDIIKFNIYPNPSINSITFSFDNTNKNIDIIIYDFFGNEVYKFKDINDNHNIVLDNLVKGNYYYKIFLSGKFISVGKIVKL